jgi:hypothetical protein
MPQLQLLDLSTAGVITNTPRLRSAVERDKINLEIKIFKNWKLQDVHHLLALHILLFLLDRIKMMMMRLLMIVLMVMIMIRIFQNW